MEKEKNTDLGNGKIKKLLFSLAVPAIIAQLVNVLYNIVDRIFIGRMVSGELAMAGVGVAFPIIMIVSAFSALIGMGGAPLAAIKMGKKDNDGAEKIMTNSFTSLIGVGVLLTTVFLIFKEPILIAFGASSNTLGYAMDYLAIYLIGTVFVQIALGMNPFINTQGFAKIGMATVMIGAVINIILDPILIFGFDMGVKGAALATVCGQLVSAIWVLKFLFGKETILKIRKNFLVPEVKVMLSVLALGVSPFIMQATESLLIIVMNNQLSRFGGDIAVGAMTIMASIMQIVILPLMGLTQGAQPIMSYNYGAEKLSRVRETFKLLLKISLSYTVVMWLLLMAFPGVFVSIFNKNPELYAQTSWSIKIYFAGILVFGAQIACQQTFLALGQAKKSLLLALLRKVILLIPLAIILPNFFENKVFGVLVSEPVADILATIITVITFVFFYKKVLSVDKNLNKKEISI